MTLILAILAIILVVTVGTTGFVYGLIRQALKGLSDYFYDVALSFDQTGNVVAQYLLNDLLIKPNGHRAGNEDETVSQVLGVNTYHYPENRLYWLGRALGWVLDKIDKDHLKKAYNNWNDEHRINKRA